MNRQRSQRDTELRQARKRLEQARKRNDEIDDLMMRAYEDYAKGVLSLERYQKVTAKYEQEQRELADEAATLDKFVQREQESSDDFNRFMELIAKYIGIEELTPTIVNEFVQKIIVHEADKSSGLRRQ